MHRVVIIHPRVEVPARVDDGVARRLLFQNLEHLAIVRAFAAEIGEQENHGPLWRKRGRQGMGPREGTNRRG